SRPADTLQLVAHLPENAYVRAAKGINALLLVANDEQAARLAQISQRLHNGPLVGVGVLKLIDQHMSEFSLPVARPCPFTPVEQIAGHPFQIIKIELAFLLFGSGVSPLHPSDEAVPQRQ